MRSLFLRFACATCLLSTTPALAEAPDGAADDANIVVLGGSLPPPPGTPAYGSVTIEADRLRNSASNRIENVLADVAGFQQFRRSDSRSANPSAQGATLRALGGNASSRTLVLLDGVPVADPFFGYIPFNALTPEHLSLVRVTRGGGIGAFGAGAVAGTVELTSATRSDLPLMGASALVGSRDSTELSASFSPDLGAGFVSVFGRWDKGDGFWTAPRDQRVLASVRAAYENWSAGVRAVAPLSPDFELQARGLVFRDDRVLRFAGADSHSEGQDASIRLIGRGAWGIDAVAYVQARNFSNIVISASSFRKTLDQRNTPSTGIGGKIELRPPVGDAHMLRIGADVRHASGDMWETAYSAVTGLATAHRHAGGDQTVAGAFVEDDWTLGRLILTGGVLADRWSIGGGFFDSISPAGALSRTAFADRSDWQASGRAGALYRIDDTVALRAAAYTGFRLPTLNELYRPFRVNADATGPNPNLKSEKLKGVEVGVDLTPARNLTFAATAFYNKLDNAIANVTIANGPGTFPLVGFVAGVYRQRQNVDAIVAKGIELSASAHIAEFSLNASYAFSDSKVKAPGQAFDGFVPAQTPRHSASATIGWEQAHGPALSASLHYVSRQYEDDLSTDVLPAALTVDGVARVPLGRGATLVARAENIFDEKVYTRKAGGSVDLGTPRTLWIGVRFAR